jgi:hypothetical protein
LFFVVLRDQGHHFIESDGHENVRKDGHVQEAEFSHTKGCYKESVALEETNLYWDIVLIFN